MRVSNNQQLYLDWIVRGLQKPGKTKKGLAGVLGVHPSGVTALLKGERRLQLVEVPKIAAYLEEEVPQGSGTFQSPAGQPSVLGREQAVPLMGISVVIAPSVWREAGVAVAIAERIPSSPDPRVSDLRQYACKIEAEPNRFVICVPYSDLRSRPVANDVVHVRRTRKGFHEDTLRTVRISSRGQIRLELQPGNNVGDAALTYPAPAKAGETVEIKGLVVGYHEVAVF